MSLPVEVPITHAKADGRPGATRIPAVDCLRGAALGGMILYHLTWDLHAFDLSPIDPGTSLVPRLFGHGVATVFLGLSGFGIALAQRRGFRLGQVARRLGAIAAAAATVTLVTMSVVPGGTIWFGILHCILITNIVALVLQRVSNLVLVTLGVLAATIPLALPAALGGAGWAWTGLSDTSPATLDFRPLLPWLSPVLIGMVAGRTHLVDWMARFSPRPAIYRVLATGGRHSLLVYLLHQPFLIGLLIALYGLPETGLTPTVLLSRPRQAAEFLQACEKGCVAQGRDEQLCSATCHCVLTATLAHPALRQSLTRSAPDAMRTYIAECQSPP
ncbi:DUF1624 domain-containing protein [Lichenifustis flavocetrariae]|uniref:DUF1624 domain-containing protein n=1 Tax=Lichenifustis flavocetrariae TaxID=2949735 RepID=A0AA41YY90_9HYPH|nr:heparan-alpha-glucosaminide N-acetyltransferase [Lichenifustis flavocetrariae]MCW6507045.1 DUF1624 domain-containing protein [Lichenifustis flavocetrariae]